VSLHYSAARFLLGGFVGALSGWEVRGREHVPKSGGVILASNHISFWDPVLVGTAAIREQHFLAKEELFRPPVMGWLIRSYNAIPIRRGMADLAGLTKAMDVLRAGRSLILFPEGTRARGGELRPARPGLGMLAVATDARVVPTCIMGSDRPRKWLLRQAPLRVEFAPSRTWRELAGTEAGLEPGRALYESVGAGAMREIAAIQARLLKSVVRGTATP
jgi:1-acyl-sn-glycerol-3-phosphate acyltransferase